MIPFHEIDQRLKNLGKDRAWLAETTRRSPDSIRVALAPNAPAAKRSKLLQKAISDAIEREENAASYLPISANTPPPDRITVEVDPDRMSRYCEAAAYARQDLKSWTISELNRAAQEWIAEKNRAKISVVQEDRKDDEMGNG